MIPSIQNSLQGPQGPALRGGLLIAREGLSKSKIGSPQGAD